MFTVLHTKSIIYWEFMASNNMFALFMFIATLEISLSLLKKDSEQHIRSEGILTKKFLHTTTNIVFVYFMWSWKMLFRKSILRCNR